MDSINFRDQLLSNLSKNFNAESLNIIDETLINILQDIDIVKKETSLAIYEDCTKEALEYLARKKTRGLSKGTLQQYSIVLKAFILYVPKKISDISEWDIITFLNKYEKEHNIGKRRKNQMRVILNGFFQYCTNTGKITRNPVSTVEPIKYKKTNREGLTDIEIEKIRYICTNLRDRALFEFLFATGCRISEAANVDILDIDFEQRCLKVCGKGNKDRTVLLNASAVLALQAYLNKRVDNNPALFVSCKSPYQRLTVSTLEKNIKRLGEQAQLSRKIYPHLIRHTTATHLLYHGMPLDQVQSYIGHENINTTRIYAKTNPEAMINTYRKTMI